MDGKENIIIVKSDPQFEWERKAQKKRGGNILKSAAALVLVAAVVFGGAVGGMFVYDRYIDRDGHGGMQQISASSDRSGGSSGKDNSQKPDGSSSGNIGSPEPDGGSSGNIGSPEPDGGNDSSSGSQSGSQDASADGNSYVGGDVTIQQVTPGKSEKTGAALVYERVAQSAVLFICETDVTTGSSGDAFGSIGGSGGFGGNYGGGSQQPQTSTAISYGSGVILSSDGYIMTNAHVVDGVTRITVELYDGRTYDGYVVGADTNTDVAVVKINETGLAAATFADSNSVVIGDEAYVVGSPLGPELAFSMTCGYISSVNREIAIEDTLMSLLQVDAAVNPGNSGGPMADSNGYIIGIVNAKMVDEDVEGIGFAIPANTALSIASELIKYGKVASRPMLGITVESIQYEYAIIYKDQAGITVTEVGAGTCAEKAGIQVGDKITHFNGVEVWCNAQLNFQKEKYKIGDTVTVTVERDGKSIDLTVTLEGSKN
ncbi:MAG: trypsin-like peptidase domain-containing protein [Clostridia bacterium]|nr:trypsin-like peptidase domain-containing protein [Clostridia bacterium]